MANRRNRASRIAAVALTLTVSHLASVRPYVATYDEINIRHSTAGTNGNKTYKVYEFKPHLPILGSSRLVPIASEDERHDPDVIWSTNAKLTEEIEAKVAESMRVRLKRRWDSGSASFDPSEYSDEQMKSTLHNMTQEELNSVDPNWNIFIQENTDGGMVRGSHSTKLYALQDITNSQIAPTKLGWLALLVDGAPTQTSLRIQEDPLRHAVDAK